MKKVRIIPALPKENKKIGVAAYCRVSIFVLAQLRSLETQIETYTKRRIVKFNGHLFYLKGDRDSLLT